MNNKEIRKAQQHLNLIKGENVYELRDELRELFDRLIRENGEEETRITREKILTNIMRKFKDSVPPQLDEFWIQLADLQEQQEKYEEAEKTLTNIMTQNLDNNRNVHFRGRIYELQDNDMYEFAINRLKALYKMNVLKFKNGEITEEQAVEGIKKIEDPDGVLDIGENFSSFELFKRECSKVVTIEELHGRLFPKTGGTVHKTRDREGGGGGGTQQVQYDESISPDKRVKFIIDSFKIEKILQGTGGFEDYVVFEIDGEDLVIAEKFFEKGKNGEYKDSKKAATYILPKDKVLELLSSSKPEIMEQAKSDDEIQRVYHTSPKKENDTTGFYFNFKKKYNQAAGYEYFQGTGKRISGRKTKKGKHDKVEPKVEKNKKKTFEELREEAIQLRQELQEVVQQLKETRGDKEASDKKLQEVKEVMNKLEKSNEEIESKLRE